MRYGPIHQCQVCDCADLTPVIFIGYLPPVNTMRAIGSLPDEEPWFPAEVLYCPRCHLVQLGYAADPAILFPPTYPYTSGSTRILRENFADLYREVLGLIGLTPEELVVDIGSNDGTLLSNFAKGGHRVLGVEPSLTAQLAEMAGIPTLMTFFDRETVHHIRKTHGPATVVTATNVFAHIHGVHDIVEGIASLLADDGVFVSESHYLLDLVNTLQYDTIYHEHLRYYSLTSLAYLLQVHGLRVFHVKRIGTHGGSIRVYASRSARFPVSPSVEQVLDLEAKAGLLGDGWIAGFRDRVIRSKLDLYEQLSGLKRDRLMLYGVGAPSRASTLITYVGLDDGVLDCVLEIATSKKVGKYMPGTRIPVLEESKLYADQPPAVLLLSWHIADELCRNLKRRGYRGDFLIPLPSPYLIRNEQVAEETPV